MEHNTSASSSSSSAHYLSCPVQCEMLYHPLQSQAQIQPTVPLPHQHHYSSPCTASPASSSASASPCAAPTRRGYVAADEPPTALLHALAVPLAEQKVEIVASHSCDAKHDYKMTITPVK